MPRKAREKSCYSIYHIMCRSQSELLLFRDDEDKDYYLDLLERYSDKHKCSIYAYCLMDNHLHLHFDPRGFDVSKFMQCLNTAYVRYYNLKYARNGHVFQDRFESRILSSDAYNLTVSAYIHNNPHDIEGYQGREETYKYSSYGIYLGLRQDRLKLVDKSFIKGLFNVNDEDTFIKRYYGFVSHQRDTGNYGELRKELSTAVENEYVSGRNVILREFSPAKVVSYISDRIMVSKAGSIAFKARQRLMKYRAFTAYVLRVLCGLGYKEICSNMFNITISGCSRLCDRGYELMKKEPAYADIFNELLGCKA